MVESKEKAEDGSMVFSVIVEPSWEFFSLMLVFCAGVRILSSNSVVREMKRKMKKAIEQYSMPATEFGLNNVEEDSFAIET